MKSNITFKPNHLGECLIVMSDRHCFGAIVSGPGGRRVFSPSETFADFQHTQTDLETIAAACSPVMFDYLMMGGDAYNGPVGATHDPQSK